MFLVPAGAWAPHVLAQISGCSTAYSPPDSSGHAASQGGGPAWEAFGSTPPNGVDEEGWLP